MSPHNGGADAPKQRRRQLLASELRRLRELAGRSGTGLAEAINISQPTLSRIERGARLPTVPEVRAWAAACGATQEQTTNLVQLTQDAYTEVESYSDALGDAKHLQGRAAEMEQAARTLRSFEPIIVPGLLQTAEYARRAIALSPGTVDHAAALAARIDRQQILYSADRSFEFLMTEAAIRWPAGPMPVRVDQLERLVSLAARDNVRIGVLPIEHEPTAIGWHEFTIYEDVDDGHAYVHTELAHVMLTVNDPTDVEAYRTMYERLSMPALFDQDAINLIRSIARSLG